MTVHAERLMVEPKDEPVERVRLTTDERTETVTGEVRKEQIKEQIEAGGPEDKRRP
ncbi:hypothetical protein [Streptomyces sp. 900105755]